MNYLNLILNHCMRKKVNSLDQILSYMNEKDILDGFPGIGNAIASDVVRAVSYHEAIM